MTTSLFDHPVLSDTDRLEWTVDATPGGIDRWCSGPDWVLPAHTAFADAAEPIVVTHGNGLAALARYTLSDGSLIIAGLEPLWGFASPILGPDPAAVAAALTEILADIAWHRLYLPGFPNDLTLARSIAPPLARLGSVVAVPGIGRRVADISSYGAWWARRSARFRRNLRRAEAGATASGLELIDLSLDAEPEAGSADRVIDRLIAIERRSWKADPADREGPSGIMATGMEQFYRSMTARLRERDRCRVVVASRQGVDVGYILGGVRRGRYRGLQLSYTVDAAELSIGHLLQHHEIRHLTDSGRADVYDLGMDMGYKASWADRLEGSVALMIDRSS